MRTTLFIAISCALAQTASAQQSNTSLDIQDEATIPIFGPGIDLPDRPEPIENADEQLPSQDVQPIETELDDAQAGDVPADSQDEHIEDQESRALPAIEQQPLGTSSTPQQNSSSPLSNLSIAAQTFVALVIVVGLALVLRYIVKTAAGRSGSIAGQLTAGGRAPSGVLSILGRYPIARGQTLVLLKLDRRILLLCQTPSGFSTLTSVTDPDEVASILTRTEDEDGNSMTQQFREALTHAEQDPAISGNGTLELPDNPFQINGEIEDKPQSHAPLDPVASLKKRLEQLGGSSA
ncbi:MAG: FliO/MopB family protein [Planctomycetota bacterium]|jgi:flagellar biogenesis protein FliO